MADYTPSAVKPATIHLWDTNTLALGGLNGDACAVLKELANYCAYLETIKAPLSSPALTDIPTAPTAPAGTNTTQVATTAFVTNLLPPGTLLSGAWTTPPVGTLKANGAAVLRATYSNLATAIYCGDSLNATADWGYRCTNSNGTGRSTSGAYIVLPDMRGEFVRGWDDSRGVDDGRLLTSAQKGTVLVVDIYTNGVWTTSFVGTDISSARANIGLDSYSASDYENVRATGTGVDQAVGTMPGVDGGTYGSGIVRPRNLAALFCIVY